MHKIYRINPSLYTRFLHKQTKTGGTIFTCFSPDCDKVFEEDDIVVSTCYARTLGRNARLRCVECALKHNVITNRDLRNFLKRDKTGTTIGKVNKDIVELEKMTEEVVEECMKEQV